MRTIVGTISGQVLGHICNFFVLFCFTFSNFCRFFMHHNFLDNETHARESLSIDRIPPDSVFINLMDPIYQTYQIIHSCFGAATSHFIVESAKIGQTSKSVIQNYYSDKGSFGIEGIIWKIKDIKKFIYT